MNWSKILNAVLAGLIGAVVLIGIYLLRVTETTTDYKSTVEASRRTKDSLFKTKATPLPHFVLDTFSNLAYYDVNPNFKLSAQFSMFKSDTFATLIHTDGSKSKYKVLGQAEFNLSDTTFILLCYAAMGDRSACFIPFADSTNLSETNKFGRYIEFTNRPQASFILDFNYAFNPYCAYNHLFICPIAPTTNKINVAIRAGEKRF